MPAFAGMTMPHKIEEAAHCGGLGDHLSHGNDGGLIPGSIRAAVGDLS